jgi:hypothetical protein
MALKKQITIGASVYPDAYIKVASTSVSKITSLAKVVIYENQSGQPIETKEFGFVSNIEDAAPNALKQAYEHIKKLPEFSNATDC